MTCIQNARASAWNFSQLHATRTCLDAPVGRRLPARRPGRRGHHTGKSRASILPGRRVSCYRKWRMNPGVAGGRPETERKRRDHRAAHGRGSCPRARRHLRGRAGHHAGARTRDARRRARSRPGHRQPGAVELLTRLEQAFDVRLPDSVLGEAESIRDLLDAALAGGEPSGAGVVDTVAPIAAGTSAPDSARTLIDVLRWHAETDPGRVDIVLRLDDAGERRITYGELWARAGGVAAGLRARGIARGESVALMLRTEPGFFAAFFGVLLAGAVPVPIYPPTRPSHLEEYAARQVKILDNAQARLLVTFAEAERVAGLLRARVQSLTGVTTLERLAAAPAAPVPAVGPDDPALIQYTSGSTGDPKGVLLSHANLLANIRALGRALGVRPDDVCVSWLPLYHDMGLIGMWLGSLYHGVPVVILPPLSFLARPARWLRAISAHRATISAAPNFAFDLCVKRVAEADLEGVNLESWRLALNGSEAVSPETIERFVRRFVARGFRAEAMCPVYGLAESSVGLTMSPPGRGPLLDRVRRETFERSRRAEPAAPGESSPLSLVSCGAPCPDMSFASWMPRACRCPTGSRAACSSAGPRSRRVTSVTRLRRRRCCTTAGWIPVTSAIARRRALRHRTAQGPDHQGRAQPVPAGGGGAGRRRAGRTQGLRGGLRRRRSCHRHRAVDRDRGDARRYPRGASGARSRGAGAGRGRPRLAAGHRAHGPARLRAQDIERQDPALGHTRRLAARRSRPALVGPHAVAPARHRRLPGVRAPRPRVGGAAGVRGLGRGLRSWPPCRCCGCW